MEALKSALKIHESSKRQDWLDAFAKFDCEDVDESITLREFEVAFEKDEDLKNAAIPKADRAALFKEIDGHFFGDGNIKMCELQEALRPSLNAKRLEFLKKYFNLLTTETGQTEGDMELDVADMKRICNQTQLGEEFNFIFESMLKRYEEAGKIDGKITFDEFKSAHVRESQKEYGDNKEFQTLVQNCWGKKMDFVWE